MERQSAFIKKQADHQKKSLSSVRPASSQCAYGHPLLDFQRTIGNQAVGRFIQAKLKINQPGDVYEQEADRMADQVMQMGPPNDVDVPIRHDADASTLRRTPESPYSLSEGTIVEGDEEQIQTKTEAGSAVAAGPAIVAKVVAVVRRPGTALPDTARTFMESRLGYDFSGVKIHADETAAEAAELVNARAFTKGANIVFGRGQYSPSSHAGRWLLAHESTHVIQQGKAETLASGDSSSRLFRRSQTVTNHDLSGTLRRVKWNTARDTGKDSFPWGSGPKGDIYEVKTDAGTKIDAWKPHDGKTYWCHGYTFGGAAALAGPFSIWGQDVPTVLQDDGWQSAFSCVAQRADILVFSGNNVAHSGIVNSVFEPGGIVDENNSMLDSKWGQLPLNKNSWAVNAKQYGQYGVFSK